MNDATKIEEIQLESPRNIVDESSEMKLELKSFNRELLCRIEKLERKYELKNENKSKVDKMKIRTCELLEVSTIHGIPNMIRSKKLFIFVMWSTFTILSACLGSYFVIDSVLNYLKFESVTKIVVINEKQALTLLITQGLFQKGDNVNADAAEWKAGEQVFEKDGRVIALRSKIRLLSTRGEAKTPVLLRTEECSPTEQ